MNIQSILSPKVKYTNNYLRCQEIKGLTKRLCIQILRRPVIFILSIIQPLLWLVLFSSLFQNAPITFFTSTYKYNNFISAGIIVFTIFTGSLNAGLPLMFDREFGFLNRLLCSPITTRYSIIISSCLNIVLLNIVQITIITSLCHVMGNNVINTSNLKTIITTLFLFSSCITSISLIFAIILPGHVELLAFIVSINLPLLFSSTALAPLIFMPSWLQVMASINPLTYVIEVMRYNYVFQTLNTKHAIMTTLWGKVYIKQILLTFCILNSVCVIIAQSLISKKFDE